MTQDNQINNKRIAKNTLYLYFRMFVMIIITLYSSRIILKALGIEDFGLYNLIGGVVVLLSFINNAMTNATQRFLSYALGINNHQVEKRTFCMSINCHIIIAIILFVLAETIGLWFIFTQLHIPLFRNNAVFWVFQFSTITFILNIIRVPYNASIIAHEHMSFYAYTTIIDALLRLFIAFSILYLNTDKLILYSFLLILPSLILNIVYWIYCKRVFGNVCSYNPIWDKRLFHDIMHFSGWSMVNGGASISSQQGGNFLVNIFSGVTANAAYGISNQVSSVIYGFVSNFQTAFQPQIVKLYASGNKTELHKLIFRASTLSFLLLFAISLPLIDQMDFILSLWLEKVPDYSATFCRLLLLFYLVDAIQAPLWMLVYSTGNIKQYTIVTGLLTIINLPISYLFLIEGAPIYCIFIIKIALNIIVSIYRILYAGQNIDFPYMQYFKLVISRILLVSFFSTISIQVYHIFIQPQDTMPLINIIVSIIFAAIYSWYLGMTDNDKKSIKNIIYKHFSR